MLEQRDNLRPLTCVHFIALKHRSHHQGKKGKEQTASSFMLLAGKGRPLPVPL